VVIIVSVTVMIKDINIVMFLSIIISRHEVVYSVFRSEI